MDELMDTDKRFCSIIFDVIIKHGVKDVVCSPGSRNAPLLIGANSCASLKLHTVIDERSAAFLALGMASVSKTPVALICTSGTALLNYGPAVAEAYYQSVPLIVISADRPEQWIDQDDSQTLRQFEALSNYVKKSYQIPSWGNDDPEMQWYVNRIVNDAMIEATSKRKGPVHINVRLAEPLGGRIPKYLSHERKIINISADTIGDKEMLRNFAGEISRCRVMFVAGFMSPDNKLHRSVEEFCRLPNVVAMCETLSNLNLGKDCSSVDTVLTAYPDDLLNTLAPDLVISVGGSLVSRKLKEYLRRNKLRCMHWALGWQHTTADCFMSLTERLEVSPSRFLHTMASYISKIYAKGGVDSSVGNYSEVWGRMRLEARKVKDAYVESSIWSELTALDRIFAEIPSSANLFLSNGTVVRYAQILSRKQPHASYCNRGVSGIDGSVSTAFGGAMKYKGLSVIVTGDMSMAYDVGSLALPNVPDTVRIIVIDNGGGGIFRFIPSTSPLPERETLFCVPPVLPLRELASGYGWEYVEVSDKSSLERQLPLFFSPGKRKIMRVKCDGEISADLLKGYMEVKAPSLSGHR